MGAANQMRLWSRALIDIGHELDIDSGLKLSILPTVDDGCTFNVGDGVQDIDLKIFLGSSTEFVLFDVGNSRVDVGQDDTGLDVSLFGATSDSVFQWVQAADTLTLNASKLGEYRMKAPVTKTGAYTVLESDSGTIFNTIGAGASVTFTLPAVTVTGFHAWFHCCEDEDLVVASAAGNDMVLDNDATASSLTFGTTTEQIGQALYVVSDGAQWLCGVMLAQTLFGITIV
ncbi:MAG: hypothetical protein V3S55_09410 [Nitrospiraceae bacterium]